MLFRSVPPLADVVAYLASKVSVSAGSEKCEMTEKAPLSALTEFMRIELAFQCPTDQDLALHFDAFFELVPSHTNFAQIENSAGEFSELLFTDEHHVIELNGGEQEDLATASFWKYIEMGIHHIFTGIDHMSFMLGFVLISRNVQIGRAHV